MVRLLLEHGADTEYRYTTTGITALFLAVNRNSVTLAQILLEGGADTDTSTPLTQTVPLHWAVERRNRGMALLLARYGADIDSKNRYGKSPLSKADPGLQGVLLQSTQEHLRAIRVWAEQLQEHCGLPKALVGQVILQMVLTDKQRQRFEALGS